MKAFFNPATASVAVGVAASLLFALATAQNPFSKFSWAFCDSGLFIGPVR